MSTITGTPDHDDLSGTLDDDQLYGLGGDDKLNGGAGNDWLDGGSGADNMIGGVGDDTFIVDDTGDQVTEEPSASGGVDTVQSLSAYVLPEGVENLVLTGINNNSGIGNALDNRLIGNVGVNILNGGSGDDWIDGGEGEDHLIGGAGADFLDGGPGFDYVHYYTALSGVTVDMRSPEDNTGDAAGDRYASIEGVQGSAFNDVIRMNDFTDSAWGLDGNDILDGRGGNDDLHGLAGNDRLIGGAGDDALDGGSGFDAAIYGGLYRQHLVTGSPTAGAWIAGPEGTDSLIGIEKIEFMDGSMNFDASASIWRVDRLYEVTLGRHGDPLGLNFWATQFDLGLALTTLAQGFINSAEFQEKYGNLSDSEFLQTLYENVLGREGDVAEIQSWLGIFPPLTRSQMVVGFSESPEFIQNNAGLIAAGLWDIDETAGSVARLYLGILDRAADVAGLIYHVDAIKSGQLTLGQDANNFAASPEFQDVYGSLDNSAFVELLYLNVLDRPADADGLAFHTNNLNNGFSRGDVAVGFTESPEYQIKTIGQVDQGIAAVDANYIP